MFELKIKGLKKLLRRLETWQTNLDSGHGLGDVSQILRDSIILNYQNEGRDPSWPARKYFYVWKILAKTGLKRSTELNSTHRAWVKTGNAYRLSISSTDYGELHQMGKGQATRKSVKPTETEIEQMLQALLEGFFNG